MKQFSIGLITPHSIIGKLVSFRLCEKYSHAVIIVDDLAYSNEIPKCCTHPKDYIDYAQIYSFACSDEQFEKIMEWLNSRLGKPYDLLSILGWFFGIKYFQIKKEYYCFEFCRKLLVDIGWLEDTNDLITGDELIRELKLLEQIKKNTILTE